MNSPHLHGQAEVERFNLPEELGELREGFGKVMEGHNPSIVLDDSRLGEILAEHPPITYDAVRTGKQRFNTKLKDRLEYNGHRMARLLSTITDRDGNHHRFKVTKPNLFARKAGAGLFDYRADLSRHLDFTKVFSEPVLIIHSMLTSKANHRAGIPILDCGKFNANNSGINDSEPEVIDPACISIHVSKGTIALPPGVHSYETLGEEDRVYATQQIYVSSQV